MDKRPTNPLALAVLALLSERVAHPYDMLSTMKSRHWDAGIKLNFGSLYTVIDGLRKRGYIEKLDTVREGHRPERTVYGLTVTGRKELRLWLSDVLRQPQKDYGDFEAGLTLMLHMAPEKVAILLRERIAHLVFDLDHLREELRAAREQRQLNRALTMDQEYTIVLREAELHWVQSILVDIESGTLHWSMDWPPSDGDHGDRS